MSPAKKFCKKKKYPEKKLHLPTEMKIKNSHIKFLLLILGIISLQSFEFDSFSNSNLFLDTEIEESVDVVNELGAEKELFKSDFDGGANAIVPALNLFIKNPFNSSHNLLRFQSKDLSQKPHLFILYCCLKLDC